MLDRLNEINIRIIELVEKSKPLTVKEIWELSDLRDSADELKQIINEEENKLKEQD